MCFISCFLQHKHWRNGLTYVPLSQKGSGRGCCVLVHVLKSGECNEGLCMFFQALTFALDSHEEPKEHLTLTAVTRCGCSQMTKPSKAQACVLDWSVRNRFSPTKPRVQPVLAKTEHMTSLLVVQILAVARKCLQSLNWLWVFAAKPEGEREMLNGWGCVLLETSWEDDLFSPLWS